MNLPNNRTFVLSAIFAVLLFSGNTAQASEPLAGGIGLFNSFKGFGLSLSAPSPGSIYIDSFLLRFDTAGVYSGRSRLPGVVAQFSRNVILRSYRLESAECHLFSGAGVAAGYVKDIELSQNMGVMLGVTGSFGCHFSFDRRLDLVASLSACAGAHIREHEDYGTLCMSGYLNGLLTTLAPELTILYKFGGR